MFTKFTIPFIAIGITLLGAAGAVLFFSADGHAKEAVYVSAQENSTAAVANNIVARKKMEEQVHSVGTPTSTLTTTSTQHVASKTTKETTVASTAETNRTHSAVSGSASQGTTAPEEHTEKQSPVKPTTTKKAPTEVSELVPSSYESALALEVHRLTNIERTDAGLSPLIYDVALANVAKTHSTHMLTLDYFDHVTPDGCDIACRLERSGYGAMAYAENIAWRIDSDLPDARALAAHFFKSWMESKEHRVNLLSEVVTHEGVGVVRDGNRVYVTVDFALK